MKIWEITNPTDCLTILCNDFEYAVAAALFIGEGRVSLKECPEGREMPVFYYGAPDAMGNWLRESFPERQLRKGSTLNTVNAFLAGLDEFRIAEILRSTQVCSYKEREAYQKALDLMESDKKQKYAKWWKEQRRSSLADGVYYAWFLANLLEENARLLEAQRRNYQETL